MSTLIPEDVKQVSRFHVKAKGLLKKKHFLLDIIKHKNCIVLRDKNTNEINKKLKISLSKIEKVDIKGEDVVIQQKGSKKKIVYSTKTPHQLLEALLPLAQRMKSPLEEQLPLEIVCSQQTKRRVKRKVTLSLKLSSYSRVLREVTMGESGHHEFAEHSYRHISHFTVFDDSPKALAIHVKPNRCHLLLFDLEQEKDTVMKVITKLTKLFFGGIPGATATFPEIENFRFFVENDLKIPSNLREEKLHAFESIAKIEKFRVMTEYLDSQNLPRRKGKQIKMKFYDRHFGEFDNENKLVISKWKYSDLFRIVKYRKQSLILEFYFGHPYLYKFLGESQRDMFITTLLEGCKRNKVVMGIHLQPSSPVLKIGGREIFEPDVEELYFKKIIDEPQESGKKKDKKKKKKISDLKVLFDQILMNVQINGVGGGGGKINKKLVPRVCHLLDNIQQVLMANIGGGPEKKDKKEDVKKKKKKKDLYYECTKEGLADVVVSGLRVLSLFLTLKKYYNSFATEILNGRFDKLIRTSLCLKNEPFVQYYALMVVTFGMDRCFSYKSENKEKAFKIKFFQNDFIDVLFDRCFRLYRSDFKKYSLPLYQLLSLLDLLVYSGISSTHKSIYYKVVKKVGENLEKFDFFVYFCRSYGVVYYAAVLLKVYICQLHQLANEGEKIAEKRELKDDEMKRKKLFADHQESTLQNVSFLIYFYLSLVNKDKLLLACLADVIGLLSYKNAKVKKLFSKIFPNGQVMNINRLTVKGKLGMKKMKQLVDEKVAKKSGSLSLEGKDSKLRKKKEEETEPKSPSLQKKEGGGKGKKGGTKRGKNKVQQPATEEGGSEDSSPTPSSGASTPSSLPSTPQKTKPKKQFAFDEGIVFDEPHSTKLFHAKSNKLNLTVLPRVKISIEYWRRFIHYLKFPSKSMFLVWGADTLKELSRKCRDEIIQFFRARDRYGTRMHWNYYEFKIDYECLKKEPVVGGYFIGHMKSSDFKKRSYTISDARFFLQELHHIVFFKDDDPYLRELCLKAMTILYTNFSKDVGHYIFMKSLCLFMNSKMKISQKSIAYETLVFLRSLFTVRKNMHDFIENGGTEILMHNLNSIYEEEELKNTGTLIYDMKVDLNSVDVKITSLVIDLLIQLTEFRSCITDREQKRLIPVPFCIRTMCKPENLNRIVQCLLIPHDEIYQKIIDLLTLLSFNDNIINRMYHTGFFFFVCLYQGKDFYNTLRLILKFHLRQSQMTSEISKNRLKEVFTGEKVDFTDYIPSALNGLLPREFIYQITLINRMTNPKLQKKRAAQVVKLSKIYGLPKYFSPFLVWGKEMKESMVSQIREQLNPFFLEIQKNKYEGYGNSEHLKSVYLPEEAYKGNQIIVKYKNLEKEFVCGHYYMRYFITLGRWTKGFEKEFRSDKNKIKILLYGISNCFKERKKIKRELGMCVKALLVLFQVERDLQIGLFTKYYKRLKYLMEFVNFVIFEQQNLSDQDIVIVYQSLLFMDVIIRQSFAKVNYVKIVGFIMKIILQVNSIINVSKIEDLSTRTERVAERKARRGKWDTKVRPFDLSGLNIDERLYEILLLSMDYLFFLTEKFPKLVIVYVKRNSIIWNLFMDFLSKYPEISTKEIKGKVLNLLPLLLQNEELQKSVFLDGGLILYLLHYVNTPCVYTKLSTDILQRLVSALKMGKATFKIPVNQRVKTILKKVFPNKTEFATLEDQKNLKMMTEANKIFNINMSKEMAGVLSTSIDKLIKSREPKKISFVDLKFLENYDFECMKTEVRVQEVYLKLFNVFPASRRKELICSSFIGGLLEHYREYLETQNEHKLRITMESLYICSKYQESTPFFKVLETEEVFAKYLVNWLDWEKNYEIFTFILKFLTKLSVMMPSSFFLILMKYGFLPKFYRILRVRSPNRFFQQCQNMVVFIMYYCLNKLQGDPEEDQHQFEIFVFTCLSVILNAEDSNGVDEWYHKRIAIMFSQILHRYPIIDEKVRMLFPNSKLYIDLFKNFPVISLQCFTKNKYQKPELFWSRELLFTLQRFIRSGLEAEKLRGVSNQIETKKTVFAELIKSKLNYSNLPICSNGVFLKSYVFHPNYQFENFDVKKGFIQLMFNELIRLLQEREEGKQEINQAEIPQTPKIQPSGSIFDKKKSKKNNQNSEDERSRRIRYLIASILTFLGGKDHIIKSHFRYCLETSDTGNIVKFIVLCFRYFRRYDNMEVAMKIFARLMCPTAVSNHDEFLRKIMLFFENLNNDATVIKHMFGKYLMTQIKHKKDDNIERGLSCLIKLLLYYPRISSKFQHSTKLLQIMIPYVEEDEDEVNDDDEEEEEEEDDDDEEKTNKPTPSRAGPSKYIRESIRVLMKQFFFILQEQRPGVYSAINKDSLSTKNKTIATINVTKELINRSSFLNFNERKLYRGHIVEFMNMVPKLDVMAMQKEETMLFNHKKFMNKAVRDSVRFLESLGSQKGKMFNKKRGGSRIRKFKDTTPLKKEEEEQQNEEEQNNNKKEQDKKRKKSVLKKKKDEFVLSDISDDDETEEESGNLENSENSEETIEEEEEDVLEETEEVFVRDIEGVGEVEIRISKKDLEGKKEDEKEKMISDKISMMKQSGVGSAADDLLFDLSSEEEEENIGEKKDEDLQKEVEKLKEEQEQDKKDKEELGGMNLGNLNLSDIEKLEETKDEEEDVIDDDIPTIKKEKKEKNKKVEEEEEENEGESDDEDEEEVLFKKDEESESMDEEEKENKEVDEEVEMEIKEMKIIDGMDEVMKLFEDDDILGTSNLEDDLNIDLDLDEDDDEDDDDDIKLDIEPTLEEEPKSIDDGGDSSKSSSVSTPKTPKKNKKKKEDGNKSGSLKVDDMDNEIDDLDISSVLDDMIANVELSGDEGSTDEEDEKE